MKLHLTFVVNGEEVHLEVPAAEPLHAAVQQALAKSKNTGRPAEEWELRYESGEIIADQSKPVGAYGFVPGAHLYLTLRVGAGGDASRPRR
jgi:hypothetical protein